MFSLNMSIVREYLNEEQVVSERLMRPFDFYLEKVHMFEGEFEPNCIILLSLEQLLAMQECPSADYALIVLAESPEQVNALTMPNDIEYIIIVNTCRMATVYNRVCDIFLYFSEIEARILRCFANHSSFNEIGRILFEIFNNPVSFCTPTLRIVMYVYDRGYRHLKQRYYELPENTYLPDDEYQVVITDPEYKETLSTTLPGVFSARMYGYRKLYLNIFYESIYLGRLVIDEIFEPQKPSDFSIMQMLAGYIKRAYLELCPGSIGASKELESAVYNLSILHAPYKVQYSEAFRNYGWDDGMDYIFLYLSRKNQKKHKTSVSEDMLYLNKLFEGSYFFTYEKAIYSVIRYDKAQERHFFRTIETIALKAGYQIGCSNWFRQLNLISVSCKQAVTAYMTGSETVSEKCIFRFEDYILPHLIEILNESNEPLFFLTPQLKTLMEYDVEHGTEMIKTLEVSLDCNQRPYVAQEMLHIHRTTYLYRMRRIAEITGWDLEDKNLRLYLQIALELVRKNSSALSSKVN